MAQSCERRDLDLNCNSGQKLKIISAIYGRLGTSTCPRGSISNTDCKSPNSLMVVREKCQGRASCRVSANNGVFGDPCPGTDKYLEVNYACEA